MVCKENVVSWFGNLSSYKRIDLMCTLLNMCVPFEVRYLGTCVEDIGKRDYNDLRDTEHHANSPTDLTELTSLGLGDKRTRRKLALYMALLHSCNYACAIILYKNLSNLDCQEISNLLNGTTVTPDDQPLEELLLLYTMALNHPAFTYDQKSIFGNIYVKLQEEEIRHSFSKANSSYKQTQGCTPCINTNERLMDTEMQSNCTMAPPPIQTYHGEMTMRNNSMVTGVPPGLSMPPPGLCMPELQSMGSGGATQYLHLGFPSVNHMAPWTGQVMMGNQLMYHTGDMLGYPASPLVSRQSSPSQSRSPSRSNSPMGRRNNTMPRTSSQVTQSTSNTLTTSTSGSNSQTSICSSNANSLPPVPALGTNRSHPTPLLPSRSVPPLSISSSTTFSRHNSIENTPSTLIPAASQSKQPPPPPPPRLRPSSTGDSLRETLGKEMPNFKGNLQNFSHDEIRRMSDEDLRELGLTGNAVGQLRSIVKSQTTNGLNQISSEKKLDGNTSAMHTVVDPIENEEQHPTMHHHHHNHAATPNLRRYPSVQPLDPAQIQMYSAPPPPMYTAQNAPCYACLTLPVAAGVQNRYSRCNAQHLYCMTQLQGLRIDSEAGRHCSQSSSSDSTGSRSPPETPPAAPWVTESNAPPVTTDHLNSTTAHTTERQRTRRNQTHVMRHKNQMVNGAGPPNLSPCVSFPAPPSQSQLAYLQHGHFSPLRPPGTGIYSNFSHGPYARPAYQTYQPNGEMIYQYSGHPSSGGTPPPPQNATATPVQPPYMPPTSVVTYAPAAAATVVPPPPPPPSKISCYNCGSSTHLAVDCKDQTMEDLTKKAQYRLDYSIMKQSGECPSSDK